jgi:hypothetical protein
MAMGSTRQARRWERQTHEARRSFQPGAVSLCGADESCSPLRLRAFSCWRTSGLLSCRLEADEARRLHSRRRKGSESVVAAGRREGKRATHGVDEMGRASEAAARDDEAERIAANMVAGVRTGCESGRR